MSRAERVRLDRRYEVGSDGVVYSGGLPLKAVRGTWVYVHGERRDVAYLVARAFVPNAAGRAYVRHLNGVLSDNRACNLEWCEEPERSRRRGPKPRMCPVVRIAGDGSVRMFRDVSEAALESGVGAGLIRAAIRRGGRSGGYAWRWA